MVLALIEKVHRARAHAEHAAEHRSAAERCAKRAGATMLRMESVVQAHEAAACALRARREAMAAADVARHGYDLQTAGEAARRAARALADMAWLAESFASQAEEDVQAARTFADTFDERQAERKARHAAEAAA